ncbi:MAG TPA: hypothetical protein VG347_17285 [Verrucomicrobiae bacterium]|nr:hypothetical protein [Verrucomicrobiae bacterium]
MELKIICQCGQKYKFDVEPVGGRMPFTVNCPVCKADGTATANTRLAEHFRFVPPPPRPNPPPQVASGASNPVPPPSAPPPPAIAPMAAGLRINRTHEEPAPAPAAAPRSDVDAPPAIGANRPFAVAEAAKPVRKTSFGMGLLGGLVGTLVGVLIYFLIFKYTGLRFRLLAIGVGGLAGWFAEMFGKGEGSKELGGITAVLTLAGIVGAQYFVALGWWHEGRVADLKAAQSAYVESVAEAKIAVRAVPTGSDAEIRAYLMKDAAKDGEKTSPGNISEEEVKIFREAQLPEYQSLASGQITKEQYEEKYGLKTSVTKDEEQSDENTFKGVFLLLFLSKSNLFSLAAAAGLAFKLCTNA